LRKINPETKLIKKFVPQPLQLPTHLPVAQYIRQSTIGQVKKNLQSQIQQDEELREKLLAYGWTDDLIWPISIDQGVSGQKRQDIRKGLAQLYHWIENGEIGAVAAFDASRLWRDRTHIWYNQFIEDYLIGHKIPVIFSDEEAGDIRVFWPRRQQDMDTLRDEFSHAAHQLRHVYEKMNPGRLIAIERGKSFGGHSVPMGYIVVGKKGDKHYVIYEPHAKLVRWLFNRYKELGGSLAKLGWEVRAMRFAFPPFEGVEELPHVAPRFVEGVGYPITTRGGLISILTNPAYIGWYCFSKKTGETRTVRSSRTDDNGKPIYREVPVYETVVVSKEAHEPIVDYDLFMYAYSRLSPTTLEGEANENKPKLDRRVTDVPALLDGVLESDGTPAYAMAHNKSYTARAYEDGWKSAQLVVDIETLDKAVSQAIIMVITALEHRHRKGLQDSIYQQLEELRKVKVAENIDYKKQLANIEKGIREAELEKRIAKEEEYEPGVRAAIKQLRELHTAKAEIEEKQRLTTKEEQEITKTKRLIAEVVAKWDKMKFERKQRFIRVIVMRANLTRTTPHFLKIELELRAPLACTMVGYIFRVRRYQPAWAQDEYDKLAALYPQADRKEILMALPHRTWEAIVQQAIIKGITRTTRLNTSGVPDSMTYADMALCDELDRPWPWKSVVYWEIPQPVNDMLHGALEDQALKISDLIRMRKMLPETPQTEYERKDMKMVSRLP
jgi:Resolvase, N terminal domain/Recombinase